MSISISFEELIKAAMAPFLKVHHDTIRQVELENGEVFVTLSKASDLGAIGSRINRERLGYLLKSVSLATGKAIVKVHVGYIKKGTNQFTKVSKMPDDWFLGLN